MVPWQRLLYKTAITGAIIFYFYLGVTLEYPGVEGIPEDVKNLDIFFVFTTVAFLVKIYEKVCDIDQSTVLDTNIFDEKSTKGED